MNRRLGAQIAALILYLGVSLFLAGCATDGQQTPGATTDVAKMEQQLQELRTVVASKTRGNYSDLAPEVAQLRESLQRVYQREHMDESWQELEPQLKTLEQQLRDESDKALSTLDDILEQMRTDLEP